MERIPNEPAFHNFFLSMRRACIVMVKAVVYGYSTEGYVLASQMAENGAEVHLVDESTSAAVLLRPEIAKTYPSVATLVDEEPLLDAKPIRVAVSDARYLFFAPRIRNTGAEARSEITQKFKDAVTHLAEGSSVVCGTPAGMGGNSEYMALLKHVTGIDAAASSSYHYYPLGVGGPPDSIGSVGGRRDAELAKLLGGGKDFVDIGAAERMHAVRVLSKFSRVISAIEIYRDSGDSPVPPADEMYLDSMIDGLFDLRMVKDSYKGAKSAQYLINGSVRGIDAYIRRLAGSVRAVIKENGLKVSHTDVVLAWSLDRHGMRNDKARIFQNLTDRLRSYAGNVLEYSSVRDFYTDKTVLVVACSRADFNGIERDPDGSKVVVIKAVPALPD